MKSSLRLNPGMSVRVKPLSEIAATLDDQGTLDRLPFMPEMIPLCGKDFIVAAKMDMTCVEGHGVRQFPSDDVVMLEGVHCNGSSHGGCAAACAIFWKESWLTLAEGPTVPQDQSDSSTSCPKLKTSNASGSPFCQSTEIYRVTREVPPVRLFLAMAKQVMQRRAELKWAAWDFASNLVSRVTKRRPFLWLNKLKVSRKPKVHLVGPKTPLVVLGLQPGDTVRVKTKEEILSTLDSKGKNRGLRFTPPMEPYCGGTHRVRARLDSAILETNGTIAHIPNTVILEGVVCRGLIKCVECPRAKFLWWREAWLEKV